MPLKIGESTRDWAQASGHSYFYQPQVTSTNTLAKDEALHKFKLYLCEQQSAGRGRGQNTWTSPEGSCLLSSWSFEALYTPQPVMACLIGLALYEAFSATWSHLPTSLKAPNDLYVSNKKVAGLLIENVQIGSKSKMIVGLGLNVLSSPQEISTAGHLTEFLKQDEVHNLPSTWNLFLNRLHQGFLACAQHNTSLGLSPQNCEKILQALNRFPQLKEPYLSMDSQGNLQNSLKKISWFEL